MPLFKFIGSHPKEPSFSYFDNTSQPIHIKLGNISAVYSNKKWKIDDENSDEKEYDNNNNIDNDNNENKHKVHNKKLQKKNQELEYENQQLKWKIEILLSKLAEAKYEIEQLRNVEY
ncbi:hypothetical protein BCR32DRAFT_326493 [Anaeromyces robustus]|uniref:Uncharacterized protein n=1 Tax=Anaeromyces robustus TaxID=1754192 RepID=A0A1Y1XBS6_9FUNG|nr:hypothetical protein BCR32DRAFT_326493 [Anaeromyces robustus]|eukprot:ORX83175.1 hypothetical protein BCR32DRAFT_326493 [Anaeromyces robustus]